MTPMPELKHLRLRKESTQPRIARITLNRPERLNAIAAGMPGEIRAAVQWAEADDEVHVIVLDGAGRAFCAGYDLQDFGAGRAEHPCQQEAQPWDPMLDYAAMKGYTEDFMALWRCRKPTIAQVHGFAVAGGSDIALCCDLVVMAEEVENAVNDQVCPMSLYRLALRHGFLVHQGRTDHDVSQQGNINTRRKFGRERKDIGRCVFSAVPGTEFAAFRLINQSHSQFSITRVLQCGRHPESEIPKTRQWLKIRCFLNIDFKYHPDCRFPSRRLPRYVEPSGGELHPAKKKR